MKITPINNNIIFTFVDTVNAKGEFEREVTAGGIHLQSSFDESAKSPRWVNVIAVGADCKHVTVGVQALLPNLRWTSNVKVDGKMVWRSDESQVVATRQTPDAEIVPLSKYVLFKQHKKDKTQSTGLIIVVGGDADTPTGEVVSMGPDAYSELKGSTIYYSDTNFTDTFTYKGSSLSFIKEDDIIAYT